MISLDAFAAIAEREYAALPAEFRSLCGAIIISVADEPTEEVMEAMEIEHPDDLLGLFEGVGMRDASATEATGTLPNRIWLYRLPILAYAAEGEDTLEDVIRHVLIHEIGHHFGLTDDEMYAIDDRDDV
jgi:predicted Zn-dependent protease with MMP-like domain